MCRLRKRVSPGRRVGDASNTIEKGVKGSGRKRRGSCKFVLGPIFPPLYRTSREGDLDLMDFGTTRLLFLNCRVNIAHKSSSFSRSNLAGSGASDDGRGHQLDGFDRTGGWKRRPAIVQGKAIALYRRCLAHARPHTLFLYFPLLCFALRTLSAYGSRREQIACGCMCRLDVTLAQSSSIAPDSSPRRVHLDAAVRGRLLRRAHLESLQHPASTSRGKRIPGTRFPSIVLGVDPHFLPPLVFFCPIHNFFPDLPLDPTSSRTGG